MAINVFVQYDGGFLIDILPSTQAPIFVWFDGTVIVYYCTLLSMYYIVSCYVWWLCMAINLISNSILLLLPGLMMYYNIVSVSVLLLSVVPAWRLIKCKCIV